MADDFVISPSELDVHDYLREDIEPLLASGYDPKEIADIDFEQLPIPDNPPDHPFELAKALAKGKEKVAPDDNVVKGLEEYVLRKIPDLKKKLETDASYDDSYLDLEEGAITGTKKFPASEKKRLI